MKTSAAVLPILSSLLLITAGCDRGHDGEIDSIDSDTLQFEGQLVTPEVDQPPGGGNVVTITNSSTWLTSFDPVGEASDSE